ncbi:hypothetical protein NEDG_02023 [Nematocida displodere]|uniref:Uncharacterized protein n=1 Tax=Nematocida displodere TaxID=1805483 RepID=A0A177EG61_9MICR|nr:hypothetical protein NEDG_02023 [Nematocida displodere]
MGNLRTVFGVAVAVLGHVGFGLGTSLGSSSGTSLKPKVAQTAQQAVGVLPQSEHTAPTIGFFEGANVALKTFGSGSAVQLMESQPAGIVLILGKIDPESIPEKVEPGLSFSNLSIHGFRSKRYRVEVDDVIARVISAFSCTYVKELALENFGLRELQNIPGQQIALAKTQSLKLSNISNLYFDWFCAVLRMNSGQVEPITLSVHDCTVEYLAPLDNLGIGELSGIRLSYLPNLHTIDLKLPLKSAPKMILELHNLNKWCKIDKKLVKFIASMHWDSVWIEMSHWNMIYKLTKNNLEVKSFLHFYVTEWEDMSLCGQYKEHLILKTPEIVFQDSTSHLFLEKQFLDNAIQWVYFSNIETTKVRIYHCDKAPTPELIDYLQKISIDSERATSLKSFKVLSQELSFFKLSDITRNSRTICAIS